MRRKLKEYNAVSLRSEGLDGQIDFVQVFGRCGPVHIEIGTGKACFLLNQAKAQPNVNFLGIERAGKYFRLAVDRIGRWGLTNVRIIRVDAVAFLANFIPDDSIDCFHIYFPDPWPKRRHHKRRFFNEANIEHLIRCLKTDGQIKIVSDHGDYFQQIRKIIAAHSEQLKEIEFLPAAGADTGERVGTTFERKYLKQKLQIYAIAARKI